jgi:hypothetical protein
MDAPLGESTDTSSFDAEIDELVALVRENPLIELEIDATDPVLAAEVRFMALTPEKQAEELNHCSDSQA